MREDTASAREDLSEYGDSRERLRAGRGIDDRRDLPSGGRIEEEVKGREGVATKVDRKREDEVDGQMRDSSYSSDEESYEPVFRKLGLLLPSLEPYSCIVISLVFLIFSRHCDQLYLFDLFTSSYTPHPTTLTLYPHLPTMHPDPEP